MVAGNINANRRGSHLAGTRDRVGALAGIGVEMVKASRLNAAGVNEGINLGDTQTNHPSESVGRKLAFIDEPVQGACGHAQPAGCFGGTQPFDSRRTRSVGRRGLHKGKRSGWGTGSVFHTPSRGPVRPARPNPSTQHQCREATSGDPDCWASTDQSPSSAGGSTGPDSVSPGYASGSSILVSGSSGS